MEQKVKDLENECESMNNTIAVSDMLHESFKERMRDKYWYDSDYTESDYESDEEKRDVRKVDKRRD